MHRAQNGAVARGLAGCLEICVKLRFVHLAQHISAEYAGHAAHFRGDGGVFVRQIRVVRAGVERAERVAAVREVKCRLPDDGVRRIGKVDEDQPADARGHLIHEAAGLAEIDVFGVLADLRDLDGGAGSVKKQLVADRADQNLERGGGGQARARQDGRADNGVEALQTAAAPGKRRGDAAHERGRGIFLLRMDGQIVQVYLNRGVALGRDADDGVGPQRDLRRRLQIDGRGQHAAVLMVGMVAADLRAARRGKVIACLHMQVPPFPTLRRVIFPHYTRFRNIRQVLLRRCSRPIRGGCI